MFVTTIKKCFHKAKFKTELPDMESSVNCSDNNEISKSIISGPKLKLILIIIQIPWE